MAEANRSVAHIVSLIANMTSRDLLKENSKLSMIIITTLEKLYPDKFKTDMNALMSAANECFINASDPVVEADPIVKKQRETIAALIKIVDSGRTGVFE